MNTWILRVCGRRETAAKNVKYVGTFILIQREDNLLLALFNSNEIIDN